MQQTLIVHGNKDIVVQPINALLLAEQLPNAQLVVYPDRATRPDTPRKRILSPLCLPFHHAGLIEPYPPFVAGNDFIYFDPLKTHASQVIPCALSVRGMRAIEKSRDCGTRP
jgi:hypothetical protein